MIKEFLESLEDPKRRLLGPNIWIMSCIGAVLPENNLAKMGFYLIQLFASCFVISQYIEIYVVRSDADQVLENLKISMLSIVCVTKAVTCFYWQDKWLQVLDYITEADEYERMHQDKAKGKIIDRYTKYCRRVSYLYWVLVLITFITVSQTPLLQYLSSQSFRDGLKNGTVLFPHIFSSWMPFDKYHSPGCWLTIGWHTFAAANGSIIMAAYDSMIVVIMTFFGGKLDLLRERAKQMLGTSGHGISDDEAGNTLRRLHQDHVLLVKYSRLFNSLLSPVMFMYVVMCSIELCASAFQFTIATTTTRKLLMAEFLVFGVLQLFNFCWHSNDVLIKSDDLMLGAYESEWWAANVKQRKSILILAGQFRIKHIFTAGPFTNLTLSTFITILKGAYSYFTLLRE